MATYRKELDRKRIDEGLTITQLAAKTGLGLNAVSQIINGRTTPRTRTRHLLADALNTTPEEIFPEVAK